jgi:hypothetical protein
MEICGFLTIDLLIESSLRPWNEGKMHESRKLSILHPNWGLVLLALVISAHSSAAQLPPQRKSPPAAVKPSLDALVQRANSYWSLLEKGNKLEASKYVTPESRNLLVTRPIQPFSKPRVTGMEFLKKSGQVRVTITVETSFPQIGQMEWQVTEDWTFINGNWFTAVQNKQYLFPTQEGKPGAGLTAQETEQQQKEIRAALRFESPTVDFGTVRKGETAEFVLKYALDGDAPFDFRFKDVPRDLPFSCRLTEAKLKPGKDQSIPMQLSTEIYDGQVQIPLTIQVRHREVEVLYPIEIRGMVYAPVSVRPARMLFLREEKEKDLEIRNNSKSEVKVTSVSSEGGVVFAVGSLPFSLPPGGQTIVKVQKPAQIGQTNYRDSLLLALDKPVDGVGVLTIPVIINYIGPAGAQGPSEIEELRKKLQQPPIKP